MTRGTPWIELTESDRNAVLAGIAAAGVIWRDEGFSARVSKVLYDLASNSADWPGKVERLLLASLIQFPLENSEQRAKVLSAIEVIGRLAPPRDTVVQVFVNTTELRWLEDIASLDNVSVSDYVRLMALAAITEGYSRPRSDSSRPARIGHPGRHPDH